jgi:Uma2 family endonuclease
MAVAPTIPLVSADEYLNSSYHPDMEYVDGVLLEHGLPTIAHGFLQLILCVYLDALRTQFEFEPLPEVRTQIIEGARYRIPDVMLCPVPVPAGKVLTSVPWAVIEILSPEDRFSDLVARFQDYKRIGVRHLVLLDPEDLVAYRFENGALAQTRFTSLELPTGDLPFDSEELFQRLAARLSRGATLS